MGIGISLKQSLVLKSGNASRSRIGYPRTLRRIAATMIGLRRSRDGGYSGPQSSVGRLGERTMNHVIRSRFDTAQIYVGSRRGVGVQRHGGNFNKVMHRRVVASDIRWIEEHPVNRNLLYIGTTSGLSRSDDGGRSFALVHRSPWPSLSHVSQVRVDPTEPKRVWLGTEDGLLVSRDNGLKYRRAGNGFFTGKHIVRIAFSGRPGHVIVGTVRDLWESNDAGASWQVAYFGPIQWDVRNLIRDSAHPDSFLIATTAEILRFGPIEVRSTAESIGHIGARRRTGSDRGSSQDLKTCRGFPPDSMHIVSRPILWPIARRCCCSPMGHV